jgi:hypothetical protein
MPECPHCGEELHGHERFHSECYSCAELTPQEQDALRRNLEEWDK